MRRSEHRHALKSAELDVAGTLLNGLLLRPERALVSYGLFASGGLGRIAGGLPLVIDRLQLL